MVNCTTALAAAIALGCGATGACAARWQPVPGAPEVDVDLRSLYHQRPRVVAWVRWPGRAPLATGLAAPGQQLLRIYRTAMRAEFDCALRTVRVLAANAYDSGGQVLYMSSLPGAAQPVPGGDMAWTYDAVCEAARAGGRG